MTTFQQSDETCAVCGATSQWTVLASYYQSGSVDMDTRPPGPSRRFHQIHSCPQCGYCSPRLDISIGVRPELLVDPKYRLILEDKTSHSPTCNWFRCWGYLCEAVGQFSRATWALIYAAWLCDDVGDDKAASEYRRSAFALSTRALGAGQRIARELATSSTIRADLMRRCGEFAAAQECVITGLAQSPTKHVPLALEYEQKLIDARDTACHALAEALPPTSIEPTQSAHEAQSKPSPASSPSTTARADDPVQPTHLGTPSKRYATDKGHQRIILAGLLVGLGVIGLWFMDATRRPIGSLAIIGKGVALVLGLQILAVCGFRLIRFCVHLVIENPIQAPQRFRPVLFVLGAFLFASAYPMLYDFYLFGFRALESPYFWTLRTIRSAQSSGFLVLLLVAWLLIVRSFIRQVVTNHVQGQSRRPLLYCFGVVVGSLVVSRWFLDDHENTAYAGLVLVGYLGIYLGGRAVQIQPGAA